MRPYRSGRSFTRWGTPRSVSHRPTSSRPVVAVARCRGADAVGFVAVAATACQQLHGHNLDALGDVDQPGEPVGSVGHVESLAGDRAVAFPDS